MSTPTWPELLLSIQRGLLFNITPAAVSISVEMTSEDTLLVKVQLDNEPDKAEKDYYYAAAAEMCGDFIGLASQVLFHVSAGKHEAKHHLKWLVYARAE